MVIEFEAASLKNFIEDNLHNGPGLYLNKEKTDWVPFTRIQRVWAPR